ncbi:hypothetical protein BSL78_27032 [Apostichopus japonicus]|uniref:Uncharacterized protein n=1 Tax=Stichopus japonicus TaxID=307972 RepID=A0A2G8JK50_STIJA|nr:hypothetical protein BSL78_27032 [Apostichopus japonicus]
MAAIVQREIDLKIDRVLYWTESTAVLRYISNDKARYHTIVANRIQVIREVSTPSRWHHVATKMNPADLPSRCVKTTSIFNNSIWFGGPHFLRKKESEWPKQIIARSMEEGDPEVKVSCASLRCEEPTVTDVLVTRISNWLTLRRVMAWVCLATKKFLKLIGRSTGEFEGIQRLTPKLLDESEAIIVKDVQRKVYSEEIEALSNGNVVARGSPLFKYSPMLTAKGVIRIGVDLLKLTCPMEQSTQWFYRKRRKSRF